MCVGTTQTADSCPLCRTQIKLLPVLLINRHNLQLCMSFLGREDAKKTKVHGVNIGGIIFNNSDSISIMHKKNVDLYEVVNSSKERLKMFTEVDTGPRKALGMNLWVQNDVEIMTQVANNAIKRSVHEINEDKKVLASLKRSVETMQDKITGMKNHIMISEDRIAMQEEALQAYDSVVSILKKIKTSNV